MNSTTRIAVLTVVLACIATAIAGPAVGQVRTVDADLAVDQPDYADGRVDRSTSNGTAMYTGVGPMEIAPQNFDPDDVENFGVATPGAKLTYDGQFEEYVFRADEPGTYRVWWETSSTAPARATSTNGTENGSANASSTASGTRYTAQIRLRSGADVKPVDSAALDSVRERADKWEAFNATVQDLREEDMLFYPDSMSTDETIETMIAAYRTQGNPIAALSGNVTTILIIMGTTLGGIFFAVVVLGYMTLREAAFRKKLHQFELTEDDEGEWAKKQSRMAKRERLRSATNTEFQDLGFDDYWAHQLREAYGQNFARAWESILGEMELQIPADWLAIMAQNGYVGVESGDTIDVVDERSIDETDEPIDLAELDESQVRRVAMDEPPVSTFDLESASIDWEKLGESDMPAADLEGWADRWDLDVDHDADLIEHAEMLREFADAVQDHEFTDEDGAVVPTRAYLEALIEASQEANRYQLPMASQLSSMLIMALDEYSPEDRVEQTVDDIQNDRFDAGDMFEPMGSGS